jgi:Tol biopolymer transport system component/tRNA A-37 threonylcarbamoyl transferase component Bud32
MNGRTIAHYELLEKLGEGGMGVVYKARDTRLNRFVALKLLPSEKVRDEERLRRFTQEARTASGLNHPNIITIHDIATADGTPFMVMEYVAGKTLDQIIPRKGMRLAEVLKIAAQMGDALAAAAAAGVIHRDIKPGNVMVGDNGHVKVLDFGLAKLSDRAASSEQATATIVEDRPRTREGVVIGTVSYMSPEQAEGRPLDPRSDIFSFGAVLYEMVTGQRAFRGETSMSTISSILRDDPQPAGTLSADVPRDLEKIIARCLRKDPERRFQTMADVRVAILELKEESESGRLAMPAAAPAAKQNRLWAFGACAVILVAAAVYFGLRSRQTAPVVSGADPRTVPFTSYVTAQEDPAFSPDGNQIAFSWSGDRDQNPARHIYVKLIGTDTPLQLTSGENRDTNPAWAPGGGAVAFLRQFPDGGAAVYQVSALGGPEHRIAELGLGLAKLCWSPDGKYLFSGGRGTPGGKSRIWRISAETGERQALFADEIQEDGSPAISPDGRLLAFSRRLGDLNLGLFVTDLDRNMMPKGAPRQLPTQPGSNFNPAWSADGDIIFRYSTASAGRLWRVPASGKTPAREWSIALEGANSPAIAGNRHRLAYTLGVTDSNIWRIPVAGPGKAGEPALVIASARGDLARPGAFSPDGRRVGFESDRAGAVSVWLADADGSKPTLLSGSTDYLSGSPSWSPDGRWVAFDNRKGGLAAIYVIAADGGAPRRLLNVPWEHVVPSWSHDGKWIYFCSDHTGRFEVYKVPAGGGEPAAVTRSGGFAPMESPDGKFLYYNRTRPSANYNSVRGKITVPLLRMPVQGGEETQVLDAVYQRSWASTPQGIWFLWPRTPDGGELRFYDFATAKTSVAASLPRNLVAGLALSPDGGTLLYNQVDHQSSQILLVENFR